MQVKYSNADRLAHADIVICSAMTKLWQALNSYDFHKTIMNSHGHVFGYANGNGIAMAVEITSDNIDRWSHFMYVTFNTPEDYLQFQLTHG